MNKHTIDVRAETRVLKQLSAARLARGRTQYDGTHRSALLLLEPDCYEWPSTLLFDSALQPVDKVVLLLAMTIEARHQHHGSEAVDGGDPITVTDNRERSFTKNRTATKQELKESARGERLAGAATCLQTAGTASYHTGCVSTSRWTLYHLEGDLRPTTAL